MLGLDMMFNHKDREIARYEQDNTLIVDTAFVTDSDKTCETAILHPRYNDGKWIIVEAYDTEFEARIAHDEWVKIITTEPLPDVLVDRGLSYVGLLRDVVANTRDWRIFWKDGVEKQAPLLLASRQST